MRRDDVQLLMNNTFSPYKSLINVVLPDFTETHKQM
ncbi:hypothetical protein CoNPh11_CDS0219 [Staphylococcus phage S-CoN_Ph11]|nr:hypothetical protein CoNPh11_CDS0219 [Staphylococcus phage S-CoN_Ph11]